MRDKLKNFNWHVYGISIDDYDYTIRIIKEIIDDRNSLLKSKVDQINSLEDSEENTENQVDRESEIMDDISYYNYIENQYLWHFGLWRLQGLFEGFLQQEFFPKKKLLGINTKLNHVKGQGFEIDERDFQELLEWAKLRNALSHFPPEQFRPSMLEEEDVLEYFAIINRVTSSLLNQKNNWTFNSV